MRKELSCSLSGDTKYLVIDVPVTQRSLWYLEVECKFVCDLKLLMSHPPSVHSAASGDLDSELTTCMFSKGESEIGKNHLT